MRLGNSSLQHRLTYPAFSMSKKRIVSVIVLAMMLFLVLPLPAKSEGYRAKEAAMKLMPAQEKSYPQLALLKKIIAMEPAIDFKRAGEEREALIIKLNQTATTKALNGLILATLNFRNGGLEEEIQFYDYLDSLKVGWKSYPMFEAYVDYRRRYKTLELNKLSREAEALGYGPAPSIPRSS